ncbi:alginate O-acetyltransferase AlgF [Devosia sp.]|uniref:alginate O-acetyltransferase AlgF n=1 Tax=Devosia sp. TaxID=1871048 RepID=UPI003BA90BFD
MFRPSRPLATLSLLAVLASSTAIFAQDDGLYDAPVDPNTAFIRVLSPGAAVAVVNGTTVDQVTDGLSAYVNVQPGDIDVAAGDVSGSVSAQPGAYYTYAWSAAGEPVVLTDQPANDPSKATVYFYNFSDLPSVDLFVPSAKVKAIEGVAGDTTKSVALKAPLTLDFEVQSDGTSVAKVAALDLKRRGGVSIVFTGTAGNYTASAVQNQFFRAQ